MNLNEHIDNFEKNKWCGQSLVMANYYFRKNIKLTVGFILFSILLVTVNKYFAVMGIVLTFIFFFKGVNIYFSDIHKHQKRIRILLKFLSNKNEVNNFIQEALDNQKPFLNKKEHHTENRLMHYEITCLKSELKDNNYLNSNYIGKIYLVDHLIKVKKQSNKFKNYAPE